MKKRSGGNILVESLRAYGVKKIFCVPGESYLDALDALVDADDMRVVTCRHEGGAAFMAEAYGKLTGHAGICFVTRGPGACNASIGVHTAMQDSTPLILLVGQVARDQKGREAFQEVEYREMFQPPFTKWAVEVEQAEDIPRVMREAFEKAYDGRPGPVVVALPEDMLCDVSDVPIQAPVAPPQFAPSKSDIDKLKELLAAAKRPVVITGGGSWTVPAIAAFEAFCAQAALPVVAGFRRQDSFHNGHACYVGFLGTVVDPELAKVVTEADLIIAVGTRLGEILTQGYSLIEPKPGVPKQKLVHVYPEASELNKVYQTALTIHAPVAVFAAALADVEIEGSAWQSRTQALRARYLDWSRIQTRDKFTVDADGVFADIARVLPADAILTSDAGNFSGWAQRYLSYSRPRRQLAPTSGAMGYSVPAAVAASLCYPDRAVVSFVGDGGFMMTGAEMATAMHESAHPIILVFNNGIYGTIRMHQEKTYPGRVSATDLTNPDFAALAQSFGAVGVVVEKTDDFLPAFEKALASRKLTLIEIRMDPEQSTTQKKLSEFGR